MLLVAVALIFSGCDSSPNIARMEPPSVAQGLGLSDCQVSIPLSQGEVLGLVKKWDNHPNPEQSEEWIEMAARQRPGDQLRMVTCKAGPPYFYALVRENVILLRFHPVLLD